VPRFEYGIYDARWSVSLQRWATICSLPRRLGARAAISKVGIDGLGIPVGAALRAARLRAGLSLEQLARRSGGRYKPSSLGGYERGERAISLARFCDLAYLLGAPPDQLLRDALDQLEPEDREILIDLTELPDSSAGREVARYAHGVKSMRGDFRSSVVTLRSGDLRVIAVASGLPLSQLVESLGTAVRRVGPDR
jgi:transcriptional regulator with XRE-family HTH domain